jgi:hypothetical protein
LFYRLQPVLVFVVVAFVGMLTAIASWYTIDQTNRLAFVNIAEDAVQRVWGSHREPHASDKVGGGAFPGRRRSSLGGDFQVFVSHLQKAEQFSGVQGLGFARYVETGTASDQAIAAELARNYDLARTSWPETAEAYRTPIVMLEPANDANMRALGFDMYSEPTRRAAILAALAEERLRASGTVELVQEDSQNPTSRIPDVHTFFCRKFRTAARPDLCTVPYSEPFRIRAQPAADATGSHHCLGRGTGSCEPDLHHGGSGQHTDGRRPCLGDVHGSGRTVLDCRDPAFPGLPAPVDQTRTIMLAIAGFLLASALAASSRAQQRTIEVGEALRQQSERALNRQGVPTAGNETSDQEHDRAGCWQCRARPHDQLTH